MKFKGKIGIWVPFVLMFMLLFMLYGFFVNSITTIILSFVCIIFQIIWTLPSEILVDNNLVIVRAGINTKQFEISKIETIEKTNDPRQDFSTSLDRLKITFINSESYRDTIMVSAKDNEVLIKTLKNINPLIIYQ